MEFAAGASCGVAQCRRTSGANALGWGPDAPASNATAIAPGVDYAETATTADFATGATSAEVPVTAAQLLAFAPPAKDAVSFLLEDGATGRFMFASREAPADARAAAAELRVLHCK